MTWLEMRCSFLRSLFRVVQTEPFSSVSEHVIWQSVQFSLKCSHDLNELSSSPHQSEYSSQLASWCTLRCSSPCTRKSSNSYRWKYRQVRGCARSLPNSKNIKRHKRSKMYLASFGIRCLFAVFVPLCSYLVLRIRKIYETISGTS